MIFANQGLGLLGNYAAICAADNIPAVESLDEHFGWSALLSVCICCHGQLMLNIQKPRASPGPTMASVPVASRFTSQQVSVHLEYTSLHLAPTRSTHTRTVHTAHTQHRIWLKRLLTTQSSSPTTFLWCRLDNSWNTKIITWDDGQRAGEREHEWSLEPLRETYYPLNMDMQTKHNAMRQIRVRVPANPHSLGVPVCDCKLEYMSSNGCHYYMEWIS